MISVQSNLLLIKRFFFFPNFIWQFVTKALENAAAANLSLIQPALIMDVFDSTFKKGDMVEKIEYKLKFNTSSNRRTRKWSTKHVSEQIKTLADLRLAVSELKRIDKDEYNYEVKGAVTVTVKRLFNSEPITYSVKRNNRAAAGNRKFRTLCEKYVFVALIEH